jgi:hypothetical protein
MTVVTQAPVAKVSLWASYVLTAVISAMLLFSASMKFAGADELKKGFKKFGIDMSLASTIGTLELVSLILFLVPKTSVLGAILLTGYLGGAVVTHLRVNDPIQEAIAPAIVGVLVWFCLWLRDRRVRDLAPIRK